MRRIKVINPNSNESVTDGLRTSLAGRYADAIIECVTLTDGPFGIETDADIEFVIPLIENEILTSTDHDAFVIACYSDPGLDQCRQLVDTPVFGMQQSAVETAAAISERFGVLALSDRSIARHLRYIEKLGFTAQLAGELPLGISVDAAANGSGTFARVVFQGRRLIEEFGAGALILGCAGMAGHRDNAERELGVPVIEPAQAAVNLARGAGAMSERLAKYS
jgi:Asp/Glu/hydantoin racemase